MSSFILIKVLFGGSVYSYYPVDIGRLLLKAMHSHHHLIRGYLHSVLKGKAVILCCNLSHFDKQTSSHRIANHKNPL